MSPKDLSPCLFVSVSNVNKVVAQLPWVGYKIANEVPIEIGSLGMKAVQSCSQRTAPSLVPVGFSARLTPTITLPSPHAMRATPRAAKTIKKPSCFLF